MSHKEKSRKREVRKKIFASEWFQQNAVRLIDEVINEMNSSPHKTFTKFSRMQVQFYFQKIIRNTDQFQSFSSKSEEAKALEVSQHKNLALVHQKVEDLKVLPEVERMAALQDLFVDSHSPSEGLRELFSVASSISGGIDLINDTLVQGFRELVYQNNSLQSSLNSVSEQLDQVNEEMAHLKAER